MSIRRMFRSLGYLWAGVKVRFHAVQDASEQHAQGARRVSSALHITPAAPWSREAVSRMLEPLMAPLEIAREHFAAARAAAMTLPPMWLLYGLLLIMLVLDYVAALPVLRAVGTVGPERLLLALLLAVAFIVASYCVDEAFRFFNARPRFGRLIFMILMICAYIGLLVAVALLRLQQFRTGVDVPSEVKWGTVGVTLALTASPGWVGDWVIHKLREGMPLWRASSDAQKAYARAQSAVVSIEVEAAVATARYDEYVRAYRWLKSVYEMTYLARAGSAAEGVSTDIWPDFAR